MDVMRHLRETTQDMHCRLEELPLARALACGAVGRQTYANLLRQLLFLHGGLEAALRDHFKLGVFQPEWCACRPSAATWASWACVRARRPARRSNHSRDGSPSGPRRRPRRCSARCTSWNGRASGRCI